VTSLAAAHPAIGGLVVIYRDTLDVRAAQLPSLSTTCRTFEYQLIRVSSVHPAVTLASIYQLASTSIAYLWMCMTSNRRVNKSRH